MPIYRSQQIIEDEDDELDNEIEPSFNIIDDKVKEMTGETSEPEEEADPEFDALLVKLQEQMNQENADTEAELERVGESIEANNSLYSSTQPTTYNPQTQGAPTSFATGVGEAFGAPDDWLSDEPMDGWDTVSNFAGLMFGTIAAYVGAKGLLGKVAPGLKSAGKLGTIAEMTIADTASITPYYMGKKIRGEEIPTWELVMQGTMIGSFNIFFGLREAGKVAAEIAEKTAAKIKAADELGQKIGSKQIQKEWLAPDAFNTADADFISGKVRLPKDSIPNYTEYTKHMDDGLTTAESILTMTADRVEEANRLIRSPYYTVNKAGEEVLTPLHKQISDVSVNLNDVHGVERYRAASFKNVQKTTADAIKGKDLGGDDIEYLYSLIYKDDDTLRNLKRVDWIDQTVNSATRQMDLNKGLPIVLEKAPPPYAPGQMTIKRLGSTTRQYSTSKQAWEAAKVKQRINRPPSANAEVVEGLVKKLETIDKRLGYGVDTAMPDKQLATFERRLERLGYEELAVREGDKLKKIYSDINDLVLTFRDPKVPRYLSASIKGTKAWELVSTPEGLNGLYEASIRSGDLSAKELDKQLVELGKEAYTRAKAAGDAKLGTIVRDMTAPELTTLNKMVAKIQTGFATPDEILREAYIPATGEYNLPRIGAYVQESVQRELGDSMELLNPQAAIEYEGVSRGLQFLPPEEKAAALQQLAKMREVAAAELINNPQMIEQLINTPGVNPRLKNSLEMMGILQGNEKLALSMKGRLYKNTIDSTTRTQMAIDDIPMGQRAAPVADEVVDTVANQSAGAPPVEPSGAGGYGAALKDSVQNPFKGVEDERALLGGVRRMIANTFGTPEVNMERYATKWADPIKREIAERAAHLMDKLNIALHRTTSANKDFVHQQNNMWASIDGQGFTGASATREVINSIDAKANKLYNLNRSDETVRKAIDEILSGQSPEVVAQYKVFRQYQDDFRNWVNDHITEFNKTRPVEEHIPPIKYREGHIPYMYRGEWGVTIKHAKGTNQTIHMSSNEELAATLNHWEETKWLKSQDAIEIQVEPKWFTEYDDWGAANNLLKDGKAFGIDVTNLTSIREQLSGKQFTADGIADTIFHARHERKLNATPAKLDLEASIALSTRMGVRFAKFLEPLHNMRMLSKEAVKNDMYHVADELSDYANNVTGQSDAVEEMLNKHVFNDINHWIHSGARTDNHIKRMISTAATAAGFPASDRAVRTAASFATAWSRLSTIGFRPASAMLQFSILFTNVGVKLGTGNVMRAVKGIGKYAAYNADGTPTWHAWIARDAGTDMVSPDKIAKEKFKWLSASASNLSNFGTDSIGKPDVLLTGADKVWSGTNAAGMSLFNGAENTIRAITLETAMIDARKRLINMAKWKKKPNGELANSSERLLDKLIRLNGYDASTFNLDQTLEQMTHKHSELRQLLGDYAVKMNKIMNFDFDVGGVSRAARNPVTKPFMQFKSFATQELEFLLGRRIELTRFEQIKAWGMFATLAGATGMPLAAELNWFARSAFDVDLNEWMNQNAPDWMTFGVGALVGEGYSLRQMAGFPNLIDSFGIANPGGVLQGKVDNYRYNTEKGRWGYVEGVARSFTFVDKLWKTGELAKYGTTFRGDWSVKGDVWTGLREVFGVVDLAVDKERTTMQYDRWVQGKDTKESAEARKRIEQSSTPYIQAVKEANAGLSVQGANKALSNTGSGSKLKERDFPKKKKAASNPRDIY